MKNNQCHLVATKDLAKLYKCTNGTKSINIVVKRHINRFPERFMFRLTEEEYNNLRFQVGTANNMSRSLPYVFTEQGVAMLATILKSQTATQISIAIMDAFVKMHHYIKNNYNILPYKFLLLEEKVNDNTKRINEFSDNVAKESLINHVYTMINLTNSKKDDNICA